MTAPRAARRRSAARAGAATLLAVLTLASCKDEQKAQAPDYQNPDITPGQPVVPEQKYDLSPSRKTVAFETMINVDPPPAQINIVNRNPEPRRIVSRQMLGAIEPYDVRGCDAGTEIIATGNCSMTISARAGTAGSFPATIVINYERMTEALTISLQTTVNRPVEVVAPVAAVAAPVMVAPQQIIYYNPAPMESLAQARSSLRSSLRGQIGQGQLVPNAAPAETTQATYGAVAATVTSLPVDRRFILTRDTVIPAVLYTPVRSDQGGRAIARVTRHVFGGDGRTILIHAGSSVIGTFAANGSRRSATVQFAWDEILTPNGISIPIRGSDAADAMGRPGVPGELYSRFIERFGAAVLTSIVSNGTTYGLSSDRPSTTSTTPYGGTQTTQSPRDTAISKFGEDVSGITKRLIEEAAAIQPVVVVAGGTRINILPASNLYFRRNSNSFSEIVAAEAARRPGGSANPPPTTNVDFEDPGADIGRNGPSFPQQQSAFTQPGGFAPVGAQLPATLPPPSNPAVARGASAPARPSPVGPQTFSP